MSRSIHATARDPRDRLDTADLPRKRRIKQLVRAERARGADARFAARARTSVPVVVHGDPTHYPASAADVEALVALLPAGVTDGLASIELTLDAPDLTVSVAPGVRGSHALGRYHLEAQRIQLFGYALDPDVPERRLVETYLRLRMLATLTHEIGHHVHLREHGGRGRWGLLQKGEHEDAEARAAAIEHAWTLDYVIPYLEDVHGADIAHLRRWVEVHGGLAIDLELLVGDPRAADGDGAGARLFFRVDEAFTSLLTAVVRGDAPPLPQLAFARDLHYGEHYDEALAVLDAIGPDRRATTLRADIYAHQGRWDEAEALARTVLEADPRDWDASEVMILVARARGDWARVLSVASEALAGGRKLDLWYVARMQVVKATAQIELGALDEAEHTLAHVANRRGSGVHVANALLLLRRGRFEEAFASAEAVLGERPWLTELVAIRFDAARRLGREAQPLDEAALAELAERGFARWADALRQTENG